ncbi:MAG: type transport system ATP-binding protein [Mycobacterium sp.]|nr:type transport system ATP-binding protein [Mycobacterium sp.]MDT5284158.1 type transport system ATP-binding protein [Mycobacterium sp.]
MTIAPGAAAITVTDLSKRFGGAAPPGVLDAVNLTARGGTLSLIVGAPCSGRSTLVRCLTGVYRPDTGEVTFRLGGRALNLTAADPRTVAWMRNHRIASFDGQLAAAPRLPAAIVAARVAQRSRSAAVAALARFQAADLAPAPIGGLRTADRLTVALAAALLAERPFVVLDEPEKSADPDSLASSLKHAMDAGAAVIATGAPGSALESVATVTGELRRGRIEWHKR